MSPTSQPRKDFVDRMVAGGTPRPVAVELERRIEIIDSAENSHDGRGVLTPRELALYVGVTVAACLIGVAVMAL
ncbi:hypothetical protein [Zhihengliuella halotolerans]|uniref:Uncharacterized protein n=1 Tax=Zhihengliuella halotolerans TaxID=370736 RepID=A0A4Q8AEN4_9MICC|nr:hypothetical protein [Zhihengliuella halotolerans]RZU62281.1 hypothetical protein EV380_1874 [Zhihengliuella halotolerans]